MNGDMLWFEEGEKLNDIDIFIPLVRAANGEAFPYRNDGGLV
jgi:hypothetical protein